MNSPFLKTALALFALTISSHAVLPINYDSSAPDPNPTTQGWTASEVQTGTDSDSDGEIDSGNAGPVSGAPEAAVAWQINDQITDDVDPNFSLPSYTVLLTAQEQDALITDGWTLTAHLKAVSNSDISRACYIGWGLTTDSSFNNTGVNRRAGFYLEIGPNNSAEIYNDRGLDIPSNPNPTSRINLGPNSANDYHLVQLRSNGPGSTKFSLSVNGVECLKDIDILDAPFGTSGRLFWASNSPDGDGIANFLHVSLKQGVTHYVDQNAMGDYNGYS